MSLYVSPASSENGGTPNVRIRRPDVEDINLSLIMERRRRGFILPESILNKMKNRPALESRYWGNAPFFSNAKPAAMLERGWMRSLTLIKGQRGLLTIKDGPEMQVEVMESLHWVPESENNVYTVKDLSSLETFDLPLINRHEEWEFYIATKPVPFTPRVPRSGRGGSKKRKVKNGKKTRSKLRRKA